MNIEHILVATDLSDRARSASRHAAYWARQFGARITLLNVDDLEEFDFPSSLPIEAFRFQVESLRNGKLEAEAEALRQARCEVETVVVQGRPSVCIARECVERDVDLLILSRAGMRSPTSGPPPTFESTLENIVVPTLITVAAGESGSDTANGYKLVMAPTDFSPDSNEGVASALALAPRIGVETLNIPHVLRTPFFDHLELPPQSIEHLRNSVSEDLEMHIANLEPGDVKVSSSLLMGASPAILLAQHGKREGVDLVVLSTHGKDAARRLIGSTTRELAVQTHANTLILPRSRE